MIRNILKNKIIIIALLILSFIGILSSSISVEAAGKSWIDPDGQGDDNPKVYISALKDGQKISFGAWSYNDNVFCVDHGETLIRVSGGAEKYKLTDTYVITATDIKKNGTSINPSSDLINYAQGVAYILSLDNTWTGTRDKATGNNEGMAQHVLWAYLNDSNLCTQLGMYQGNDYEPKGDEIKAYNTALEIANGNSDVNYEATYHIFQNAETGDPTQRLIILEKTGETEVTDDLQISINKVDAKDSNNRLSGARFKITVKEDNPWLIDLLDPTVYDGEIETDENGYLTTGVISGVDIEEKLNVTIEETQAPEGYESLGKKIKFSLEYNSSTGKWESSDFNSKISSFDGAVTGSVTSSKVLLTITNEVMDSISLNLLKGSSIGAVTDGTTFSFDFTNVVDFRVKGKYISNESVLFGPEETCIVKNESGKWMCNGVEIKALIVKDGGIVIDEINFEDSDKEIEITITELEAPADHAVIKTPVKIKVELKKRLILADKAEITEHTELSDEIRAIEVVENDEGKEFQVNVDLMNFVYIDIVGQVWLDGQTGIKPSDPVNGIKDKEEKNLEGVKVYVALEGKIIEDVVPEETDENGKYTFEDVKYQPGLYVIFEYDGINYIATTKTTGKEATTSDAEEIGRKEFNEKFVKIKSDGAYYENENKSTDLNYDESNSTKAIVDTSGDIFKMQASTDEIGSYEPVVEFNCGLVKREFDLDLTTNLDFVEVKINGKTTDYNYSIDEDGNLEVRYGGDNNGGDGEISKPQYNQYIYESDYNYDLDDYFPESIEEYTLAGDEKEELKKDLTDIKENGTEQLAVFATYKIKLNNQTNKEAYIYEITDYIPTNINNITDCYIIDSENKLEAVAGEETTINGDTYKVARISDVEEKPIILEGGTSKEVYLTVEISRENINNNDKIGNIAEITSYGTKDGYIDMNSKPGNAVESGTVRYEDDTDKAGTLNLIVTDKERTLSGIVWEDTDKNGIYDDGEPTIDGVTVQLIELREININGQPYTLEYIWQETTTGNSSLDRIDILGTGIEEDVPNGVTEGSGEYKFVGYIPGNYIVRYKYGTEEMLKDGDGTANKYDGNAYKSTYDKTGANNTAGTRYMGNTDITKYLTSDEYRYSDAYDNEAKRLGEMSIFAGTTIENGSIKELEKHWMCADTNSFALHISENDNEENKNVQEVATVNGLNETTYTINKLDFGLMERPVTNISLEKHLTALSIDVAGEGKILDATFDLAGYLEAKSKAKSEGKAEPNVSDYISGNADNLTQIYSTRNERGFWKVETDVNELMNGAELSAEYTYVISNDTATPDYISKQLVEAYEKLSSGEYYTFNFEDGTEKIYSGEGSYQQLLQELEYVTKTMIRKGSHENGYYLGNFYYTGDETNQEEMSKLLPVTVRIDKIEELLNNKFNFDERINYSSYGDNENYFSAYTDKSQEHSIENAHDTYYVYTNEDTIEEGPTAIEDLSKYTIVQSKAGKTFLEPNEKDYNRKIVLTKTLNTNNINEMSFDSYNAEILSYSVASGRRAINSIPGNLEYSYSENSDITLETANNENDEFWGETIIITAPTGEDEISTTLWIMLGATCALIIAGGILGIKKFVLKH